MKNYSGLSLYGNYSDYETMMRDRCATEYDVTSGTPNRNMVERENKELIECIKSFNRPITIVDFGGGSNMAHYLIAMDWIKSGNILENIIEKYIIVDINHKHKDVYTDVQFLKNLEEYGSEKRDLFYSKGSIQYECKKDVLKQIIDLNFEKVLLQYIPVSLSEEFFSFQSAVGLPNLPQRIFSREKVLSLFKDSGYNMINDFFADEHRTWIRKFEGVGEDLWYEDFYFELKK